MNITLSTKDTKSELKLSQNANTDDIKINAHSGKNGYSAYEVAVKNGFSGTESEWLESLKGEKGDKGDKGKELKTSVIIGNATNGATADICDILYSDGDDFVEIFAAACELIKTLGIGRVEVLSGQYKIKSTLIVNIPEFIGIGRVEILPFYGEEQIGNIIKINGSKVYVENIYVGKGKNELVFWGVNCDDLHLKNCEISKNALFSKSKLYMEDCIVSGNLMISRSQNPHLLSSEIGRLYIENETSGCFASGCTIGYFDGTLDGNIIRNNIIGGEIQKPKVLEKFMNVSFGRITTETQTNSISRNIEGNSFEIYVNEKKNMTVNLYTGASSTPAKTLSSGVFIFFSGNKGEDIVDGDAYQKTLILYMKSTLGVASIGKWIAVSDSDVYNNVRIEIICPANTYRGVIKNETEEVFCND